jgi:hypothetical protein
MATTLNAGTTAATALNVTTDTTGAMAIQTSGTTAISISSAQVVTLANTAVGNITGNAGTATTATNANAIANAGGWAITPSGTKLYFSYNGTNVASMDSSGNFISLLTVAAGTTP